MRVLPGILLFFVYCALPCLAVPEVVLEYQGRYDCQAGPDHLMDVLGLSGNRAIVASNLGLALVDPTALPLEGTQTYLARLTGLNARDVYTEDGEYLYVNIHREDESQSTGLAVVRRVADTLENVRKIDEDGVLYEKMDVQGGYLYVAAHGKGIRIFSLANPADPVLIGILESGFTDAFAISVDGDTAYVADGAGGLKVVDVSDPAHPAHLEGEDETTAIGTAEDVTTGGGNVYVAAGGAGVVVYEAGDPARRTVVDINVPAEALAWVGSYLAVTHLSGVKVLDVSGVGAPRVVGGELSARRGPLARLRLASGIGSAPGGLVMLGNWNYMDVYRLVPFAEGTQPDITPSLQRIRFRPEGGTRTVSLRNDGAVPLAITDVASSRPSFSIDYDGGFLRPGESVSFEISYDGNPNQGSAVVTFASNDPDENPLPIQVFGNTSHLDPGEPAIDFTLPRITYDRQTGTFTEESFTLSDHRGKIVWFQVYGFW